MSERGEPLAEQVDGDIPCGCSGQVISGDCHPDAVVHWYFPGLELCDEYAMGDHVLGNPGDDRGLVNCQECLELIHS